MNQIPDAPALLAKLFEHGDQKRRPIQAPVTGVTVLQDIPYLSDNRKIHLMDIYYPAQFSEKLPTILDIHGGAWVHGSKEINKNYGMYLASKGFAVVNVNYTLAECNDLRTQIEDINCCMHWIHRNEEKFHLSSDNLFMCGDSSGAHLALLAYLTNDNEPLRKIYKFEKADVNVKAFGLCSPVADLHPFTDSIFPPMWDFCKRLFGEQFRASPYFYCASIQDVLRTSTNLPPVWMVSSEQDFFKKYSLQMHHLLNKRNMEHIFHYYPKGEYYPLEHVFPVLYPEYAESLAANNDMLQFFCSQL